MCRVKNEKKIKYWTHLKTNLQIYALKEERSEKTQKKYTLEWTRKIIPILFLLNLNQSTLIVLMRNNRTTEFLCFCSNLHGY